jgi:hypothetical protein
LAVPQFTTALPRARLYEVQINRKENQKCQKVYIKRSQSAIQISELSLSESAMLVIAGSVIKMMQNLENAARKQPLISGYEIEILLAKGERKVTK